MDIRAVCEQWDMQGKTVLCAVSGGRDSMALLHLLSVLALEQGFQVAAAHFNHQMRATADRDEAFVRTWCEQRGIPLTCGRGDVRAHTSGASLEDAARTLRYQFLEETADQLGAAYIATAHHREDNAETVLLHLLRGTGLQGLGGIPPVRGRIIRPLLEVSRSEINDYVARFHIPYVEDETNQSTDFTRNRLRLEVLPLLEQISPGCTGRIAAAAELLREENLHLQRETVLPPVLDGESRLSLDLLSRQDLALRRRLVRGMAQSLGVTLTKAQVDAVLSLSGGGYLDLPDGLCAVCRSRQLIFRKLSPLPPPQELRPGDQTWGPWLVRVWRGLVPEAETAVSLLGEEVPMISAWDGSGRLHVENGSRSIKRLFADRGITVERRREYPVLCLDGVPAAVLGVAVDWTRRPSAGEDCLSVSLFRTSEVSPP